MKLLLIFLFAGVAWAQSISDNFNRADGAVGSPWSAESGTWTISSNRLLSGSAINSQYPAGWLLVHTTNQYADVAVQTKLYRPPVSERTIGMVLRYTNSGGNLSFYVGWIRRRAGQSDEWRISRYAGTLTRGEFATLASGFGSFTDGTTVQFQAQGTALGLSYWTGSAWSLVASASDSRLTSGLVGLRANDQQAYFDDFAASGSSGSGPPSGGGFLTANRTVITDSNGFLTVATGTDTDCVKVNGTSGACGSGGSGGGRGEVTFNAGAVSASADITSGVPNVYACYLGTGPYTPLVPNTITISGTVVGFAFSAAPSGGKCVASGSTSVFEQSFSSGATGVTVVHNLGTTVQSTTCYLGTGPYTPMYPNSVTLGSSSTVFNFSAAPSGGKCVVL